MFFHMFTMMRAGMTQAVLAVQPGGFATPSALKIELIGPMSRNREFHTAATATVEAT